MEDKPKFVRDFHKEAKEWEKNLPKIKEYCETAEAFVRARNPYELKYFVVGRHADKVQQYKQLLCELEAKYRALEEAKHSQRLNELDIEEKKLQLIHDPEHRDQEIKNEKINLEIQKLEREQRRTYVAMLGALEECKNFTDMLETDYKDFLDKSEDELLQYEKEYYKQRFARQVLADVTSNGRISQGNITSLMQMPEADRRETLKLAQQQINDFTQLATEIENQVRIDMSESRPFIEKQEPDSSYQPMMYRKDAPPGYPADKLLDMDKVEIMIGTLQRPGDTWWASQEFYIPAGKNYVVRRLECPNYLQIGEYKNRLVMDALSLGCTHLFIIDDDMVAKKDTLLRLYKHKLPVVGGFYVRKTPEPECASMYIDGDGDKEPVSFDCKGLNIADWSLAAGCLLLDLRRLVRLQHPYFKTTAKHTEDTFFTAKLLDLNKTMSEFETNIVPMIDCDVRCGHLDKERKIIFWPDGTLQSYTEEVANRFKDDCFKITE